MNSLGHVSSYLDQELLTLQFSLLRLNVFLRVSSYKNIFCLVYNFNLLIFFFWPHCEACGILVPWPGINQNYLQWKCRVLLNTGISGKTLSMIFWKMILCVSFYLSLLIVYSYLSLLPHKSRTTWFWLLLSLLYLWKFNMLYFQLSSFLNF